MTSRFSVFYLLYVLRTQSFTVEIMKMLVLTLLTTGSQVRAVSTGPKGVPYLHTSDGRTIRYPDPNAKVATFSTVDNNTASVMCSDPS